MGKGQMFMVCSYRPTSVSESPAAMIQGRRSLATIASARERGITRVRIYCAHIHCFHSELFDTSALGLPKDTAVAHIPRRRNFVCSKCGRRKIGVGFEYPPAPGMPGYNHGKSGMRNEPCTFIASQRGSLPCETSVPKI